MKTIIPNISKNTKDFPTSIREHCKGMKELLLNDMKLKDEGFSKTKDSKSLEK